MNVEALSKLAKILFINEDKVDLNAEDLKSPCMLEAPRVAGVEITSKPSCSYHFALINLEENKGSVTSVSNTQFTL